MPVPPIHERAIVTQVFASSSITRMHDAFLFKETRASEARPSFSNDHASQTDMSDTAPIKSLICIKKTSLKFMWYNTFIKTTNRVRGRYRGQRVEFTKKYGHCILLGHLCRKTVRRIEKAKPCIASAPGLQADATVHTHDGVQQEKRKWMEAAERGVSRKVVLNVP